MRGLGGAPLPLFAAAESARPGQPEGLEPSADADDRGPRGGRGLSLAELSLRAHPLPSCAPGWSAADRALRDSPTIRTAARWKSPASSSSASGRAPQGRDLHHDRGRDRHRQRHPLARPLRDLPRQIMSASMIAMRGRLQKEGEVIHIICDRITDLDDMLRSIGRTGFTVAPGRGDGATSGGGPDPRDPAFSRGRTLGAPPFGTIAEQEEILRIQSHDFH